MPASESKVREFINNIAKEQNFQNFELNLTPLSTEGANYLSVLYIATISSEDKDDLHLFIKVTAVGQEMRDQASNTLCETENIMYKDLLPAYREIEKKHNVPKVDWLRPPKYYGANTTPLEEMLVLENMTAKGFEMYDRFKSMDWEYAATAVSELAKLHSLSIAYMREYPELFQRIKDKYLIDFMTEDIYKTFWVRGVNYALDVLTGDNKRLFKKFSDDVNFATFKKYYKPIKVKVITHGDYRPSNLMHRKLDDGGLEISITDYQTIQVGSPINDLLFLIWCGTDKNFRDKYYEKLIELYYTQLYEAMKRLDIKLDSIYSKKDFYFELREILPNGLIAAINMLPYITVESEMAPQLIEDMSLDSFTIKQTGSLYAERINGIVSDFIKLGVLAD